MTEGEHSAAVARLGKLIETTLTNLKFGGIDGGAACARLRDLVWTYDFLRTRTSDQINAFIKNEDGGALVLEGRRPSPPEPAEPTAPAPKPTAAPAKPTKPTAKPPVRKAT